MDEYIKKYLKEKNITSKHSAVSIKNNLRRVEKIIDKPFDKWQIKDFENSEKLLDDFTEKYQLNSVIVSISALKSWLIEKDAKEKLVNEYMEILKELIGEKENHVNKQELTSEEKELGEDFDWEKLQEKSKKYIEANIGKAKGNRLRDLLILSLFSLQPPARLGNYLDMEIRQGKGSKLPDSKNYLMVSGNDYKFIFNKYKTAKHLGKVELKVESSLMKDLLAKYIKERKAQDGKNPDLLDITTSQMSAVLRNVTKKFLPTGITLNPFRHSFATWFMASNPSIEEKEKITKILGQTYKPPRVEKYARRVE